MKFRVEPSRKTLPLSAASRSPEGESVLLHECDYYDEQKDNEYAGNHANTRADDRIEKTPTPSVHVPLERTAVA